MMLLDILLMSLDILLMSLDIPLMCLDVPSMFIDVHYSAMILLVHIHIHGNLILIFMSFLNQHY